MQALPCCVRIAQVSGCVAVHACHTVQLSVRAHLSAGSENDRPGKDDESQNAIDSNGVIGRRHTNTCTLIRRFHQLLFVRV